MRILMVGANFGAMRDDVRSNVNVNSIERVHASTGLTVLKDGSEIRIVIIRNVDDLFKLAGIKADMIIPHNSFPRDIDLYFRLQEYLHR